MSNHKPATALPWKSEFGSTSVRASTGGWTVAATTEPEDAAYIAHACNAYPELVEALRELVSRCDGAEGVRADGSNIQTHNAHGLLAKLGEA